MPYCRRCGTQLEENARFCHRCGLAVANYIPAEPVPVQQPPPTAPVYAMLSPPSKPKHSNNRIIILTVGLITILIVASVAAALLFTPTTPWSYTKSLSDSTPNIDTLNLNFATNIGEVNIMTLDVGDRSVLIHVQGNGSYSYLTKTDTPMTA
ncbi:MAG TPA: zinc ribbon domain-containing protein, partial [Candidatus Acidoferrales bacterium]|nr:zinc ribbon domain-containing protein [Candidatus Acidoferrales bacterium]